MCLLFTTSYWTLQQCKQCISLNFFLLFFLRFHVTDLHCTIRWPGHIHLAMSGMDKPKTKSEEELELLGWVSCSIFFPFGAFEHDCFSDKLKLELFPALKLITIIRAPLIKVETIRTKASFHKLIRNDRTYSSVSGLPGAYWSRQSSRGQNRAGSKLKPVIHLCYTQFIFSAKYWNSLSFFPFITWYIFYTWNKNSDMAKHVKVK